MEKNLTMPQGKSVMTSIALALTSVVKEPVEMLRKYYSGVLEEEVSLPQTMRLLHAQAAFVATVMPIDMALTLRALCCLWFTHALLRCRG